MWHPRKAAPSEEEFSLEKAQRRSQSRLVLTSIVAVFLLLAIRPGYRWTKTLRSRSHAANAIEALNRGDITNAAGLAQAAYLMRPKEPAALRAVAKVQTALGQTNSFTFWQALLLSGGATVEDRREFIETAIRAKALDRARPELATLVHESPNDPRNLWLLARVSFTAGQVDEAIEFLRQAIRLDPENKEYHLCLATLEYNSPQEAPQARARAKLQDLAKQQTRPGLDALTFLASQTGLSREDQIALIDRLEKHPASGTVHHLLALDLKVRVWPERRTELITQSRLHFEKSRAEEQALFGAWLNSRQEFEATLQLLPLPAAFRNRDLLLLHLDALGGLERWEAVRSVLSKPEIPLPESFIEAFRARAAAKLNDATGSSAAWKLSAQAAKGNPEQLAFLAQYAEKSGEYDVAVRFYRALAEAEADTLPIYINWLRLVEKHGTSADMRDLLKVMSERWPEEVSLRNDLAYLDLLLNRNVDASRRTAAELVKAHPENLPFRSTLALAYLRAQEPSAALEALTDRPWDWRKAFPRNCAIYAAALAANGREKEAGALASRIEPGSLRREEVELLGALPDRK